jgi:hypothetical protein
MSDPNTATIRTTVNTAVILALAYFGSRIFDQEIDINNPSIILVGSVIVGIFYRLSTVISEKVPYAGYVLFGVNRSPGYTNPPPEAPVLAEPPPEG